MRLCCAVDGDVLDDRSGASRCDSLASGRHLSMARHHGREGRLPQLSQSWLRQNKFIFIRLNCELPILLLVSSISHRMQTST